VQGLKNMGSSNVMVPLYKSEVEPFHVSKQQSLLQFKKKKKKAVTPPNTKNQKRFEEVVAETPR
jgi:hypothetical protein